MRLAYQYRLRPTLSQMTLMGEWLELCRRQYNYRFAERFNWYEQNRCDIDTCPLICYLPELKDQIKQDCIDGKFIKLPSLGKVKLILHRSLPDGFKLKTATITCKADGWYVVLSLEDVAVPTLTSDAPELATTIGIDLGLKSFLVTGVRRWLFPNLIAGQRTG